MAGRTLPNFQNNDRDFQLLQSSWSSIINPVITNVVNNSILLVSIKLTGGQTTTINTKLGRVLTGWYVVRMRGVHANIYDTQDSNTIPDKTLLLNSDVDVTVDLVVF